jgi:hypothetical protein
MLTHAQVVVTAPIYNVLDVVWAIPNSLWKLAILPDNVVENTIFA